MSRILDAKRDLATIKALRVKIAELRRERDEAREGHADADARAIALTDENAALKERVARLEVALLKISRVEFPGWEAQTAVDYCRSVADAALDVKGAG